MVRLMKRVLETHTSAADPMKLSTKWVQDENLARHLWKEYKVRVVAEGARSYCCLLLLLSFYAIISCAIREGNETTLKRILQSNTLWALKKLAITMKANNGNTSQHLFFLLLQRYDVFVSSFLNKSHDQPNE